MHASPLPRAANNGQEQGKNHMANGTREVKRTN